MTQKYQHTDALGSPVATTKKAVLATDPPVVLSRMSYTPYGAPTMPMDGVGYTGHFVDAGTQLTYMQQRYYDPQMGRFLSGDPLPAFTPNALRLSRYGYANANPYRFTDMDGRDPGDPFTTREAAAKDALNYINPTSIKENAEYAGMIYQNSGDTNFYATKPATQGEGTKAVASVPPPGGKPVARYHTHGDYSEKRHGIVVRTSNPKKDGWNSDHFSKDDRDSAKKATKIEGVSDWREYLGTPSGKLLQYNPYIKNGESALQ